MEALDWRFGWRSCRWKIKDALCYSSLSYRFFSWANGLIAFFQFSGESRLERWLKAYRFAPDDSWWERLSGRKLQRWTAGPGIGIWRESEIGWERFQGPKREGPVTRTIVLKAPDPAGEKGVLLTSFEYNWFKLLRDPGAAAALERDYDLVFATTSSPGDYSTLGLALATLRGPIYVMASQYEERDRFEGFHPRVKCLPMLPCDWIDPAGFEPKPWSDRSIDILMVAGWGPVKRHWHFFEALRSLPADLRVVLVGQQDRSYDREFIVNLARECRVPQDLEVRQSLPNEEVAALQCDSRISTIFSRREGSCFAVTESLMADSPVALMEGAHIGSAAYINEQTGCFLPLRETGRALGAFLERGESLRAREWAVANFGNEKATGQLNDFLKIEREKLGEPWTGEIALAAFKPHPMLVEENSKQHLSDAFAKLHRDFPTLFGPDLIESSRF